MKKKYHYQSLAFNGDGEFFALFKRSPTDYLLYDYDGLLYVIGKDYQDMDLVGKDKALTDLRHRLERLKKIGMQ